MRDEAMRGASARAIAEDASDRDYCVGECAIAAALALLLASPPAAGQTIPLPQIDQINGFAQYGGDISKGLGAKLPASDDRLLGFGFEMVFDLPTSLGQKEKGLRHSLAVGYDQMNANATLGDGRDFRASLRNFPSLTLYMWYGTAKSWGAYWGVGTGLVQLKDARIYGADNTCINASAETFGLQAMIGYEIEPGLFAEIGYQLRYFPSVAYDKLPESGLPADMSRDLFASGVVVKLGYGLQFRIEKPAVPLQTETRILPTYSPLPVKIVSPPSPRPPGPVEPLAPSRPAEAPAAPADE